MLHQRYADAGFTEELLPILPPDAVINDRSPSFDGLMKSRGKVPGIWDGTTWWGFTGWKRHEASATDISTWARWGAGVGMQGRLFCGVDVDVDDEEACGIIVKYTLSYLGDAPIRAGRGHRVLLPFRCAGLKKRVLRFRRAGQEEWMAVELLGDGQQYVVEGVHPKTGQPYAWKDGRSPATIGANNMTDPAPQRFGDFFDDLKAMLDERGFEIDAGRKHAAAGTSGDLAPCFEAVEAAVSHLPCDVPYDEWIAALAGIRGSASEADQHRALNLAIDWSAGYDGCGPDTVESRWTGLTRGSWQSLARLARGYGFRPALYEFSTAAGDPPSNLFERYAWVESLKRIVEIATGDLLDEQMFDVRHNDLKTDGGANNAWRRFTSEHDQLERVKALTYRPGGPRFVEENMPGLVGPCFNRWRPTTANIPGAASDDHAAPWLDHIAYLVPDEAERTVLLNFFAWVVQNQTQKPNWALVLGGGQGVGKDLALMPLRAAIGEENVKELTVDEFTKTTEWAARCKLAIIEEMNLSERKGTMNRLKPLVAAPPFTVNVNIKYVPVFPTPNVWATVFLTNMENALQLEGDDRRFFVLRSPAVAREEAYYAALAKWYAAGGDGIAARWLLSRDVGEFSVKGRAPHTVAKDTMRRHTRPLLQDWLDQEINDEHGIFAGDIVVFRAAYNAAIEALGRASRPSTTAFAAALKAANCVQTGQVRIGTDKGVLWIIRNQDRFAGMSDTMIRDFYVGQDFRAHAA